MSLIEDLSAAREHLWKFQERFKCFPDINIEVNGFRFNMKNLEVWWRAPLPEPYLKITLKPEDLQAVLNRKTNYNDLEVGCRVELDRRPNSYNPDVHTLMSFFHLPRPSA